MPFVIALSAAFVALFAPAAPSAPSPVPASAATSAARVVLFDALLVACHRPDVGWFTGTACEAAAASQTVVDHRGKARTLPQTATEAPCGGVEGYRGFGPDSLGGGRLWFSKGAKPVPCPAEKAPTLSSAERAVIAAAVRDDIAARPAAWATWEPARDGKPVDAAFELRGVVSVGEQRFVSLRGFGRDLRAVVRLAGDTARVVERHAFGPVGVVPDRCVDVDGDGQAEVWVASGGETERSYGLVRFVDGWPSTVGAVHCGD